METLRPMLDRLLPQLPDVHNVLYDGAMRASHRVLPSPPRRRPQSSHGGSACSTDGSPVEKGAPLGTVQRVARMVRVDVELRVRGGQVHSIDYDEAGTKVWSPLVLRKVSRRGRPGVSLVREYCDRGRRSRRDADIALAADRRGTPAEVQSL